MKSNVKSYTAKQLIDRMKSLDSFKNVPQHEHIIVVRSDEDAPDVYDDKLYLFRGETFIDVMPCTSNSGTYGLLNFLKWDKNGTAIIKFDEIYYNSFMKSDGKFVRHHKGKMKCLRQIAPIKYYRDNNKNNKTEEIGDVYLANNSTNVHTNSYTHKTGIRSWIIGKWSVGCTVINDLTKYYNVLLKEISYNQPVTYTGLKEF